MSCFLMGEMLLFVVLVLLMVLVLVVVAVVLVVLVVVPIPPFILDPLLPFLFPDRSQRAT